MHMQFHTFQEAPLPGFPFDLDVSNEGSLIACATRSDAHAGHVIRVLRVSDGSLVASFMQASVENGRGVAFVGDAHDLVFLFQRAGDSTQLYRSPLGSREPTELQSYPAPLATHAIIRDQRGERFAVLGRQVDIWDAGSNQRLHTLHGANPDQPVHAAFSVDGARLYTYGTAEGCVVRYDVASGTQTGQWPAPTPYGAQVLVTPDERFLVIAAEAHRGLFLYDLVSGERVDHRPEVAQMFDRSSQWRPWVLSHDGHHLMCLKGRVRVFQLPGLRDVSPPDRITAPSTHCWVAASARSATVVAFGTAEDAKVRWASYQPDDATPPKQELT